MKTLSYWILIGAIFSLPSDAYDVAIRVCQNKHCCKKNPNLLQTVHDLVGTTTTTTIEASGCLSRCEEGPNMEVTCNKRSKVLNGIDDATSAAVQLESTLETSLPKLLIAAAKVMERAANSKDSSEQITFLTSVINKLEASDDHSHSTAIAHAYALRSKAYLDESKWSLSIEDARQVVALTDVASSKTLSMAYRSWVDAEQEQGSHPRDVVAVLQAWFKAQPQYRTKLKEEITELVQKVQ